MQLPLFERAPEHLAGADQVLLADDLVERARPDAVRERGGSGGRRGRRGIEEIHGGSIPRTLPEQSCGSLLGEGGGQVE